MADGDSRTEFLLELRQNVLQELTEAERELSRARMDVERMESDIRIGLPEPGEYQHSKGRVLPQAEARFLEVYRELLKLEDKINAQRLAR